MLEKLREFSIGLWEPLGWVFNYLYESSNIWVPIISFVLLSLLSVYLLHKLITAVLSIKIDISFKTIFSLLVKTAFVLLIAAIIFSLGFYIHSLYEKYEKETTQQDKDVGYLLR